MCAAQLRTRSFDEQMMSKSENIEPETVSSAVGASAGKPGGLKSCFRHAFAGLVAAGMILANPSFAQTTNWIYTGTDPGAWDTAGNWDHGVPGLDSLAQFGEASTSGSLTTTLDFGTAPVGYREVGAISLSAAATQKHTLQSSTAGELRIDGSDTTIDETPVTLLFGNFASAQTLVIQGSGAVLTLSLYDSGVIDTVGQITLAGPIVDGGGCRPLDHEDRSGRIAAQRQRHQFGRQ